MEKEEDAGGHHAEETPQEGSRCAASEWGASDTWPPFRLHLNSILAAIQRKPPACLEPRPCAEHAEIEKEM